MAQVSNTNLDHLNQNLTVKVALTYIIYIFLLFATLGTF